MVQQLSYLDARSLISKLTSEWPGLGPRQSPEDTMPWRQWGPSATSQFLFAWGRPRPQANIFWNLLISKYVGLGLWRWGLVALGPVTATVSGSALAIARSRTRQAVNNLFSIEFHSKQTILWKYIFLTPTKAGDGTIDPFIAFSDIPNIQFKPHELGMYFRSWNTNI